MNCHLFFRKVAFSCGLLMVCFFARAQNRNDSFLRCDSFAPIIAEQIAAYGKFDDSMDRMIEVWHKKSCGWTEPVIRLLLLRALQKNDTNQVQEYFNIYYQYYYGIYQYKMKHGKNFHLLDTINNHNKIKWHRLIKDWGYVQPGSNYDSWTKSLASNPTVDDVRTTDIMCATRLMLADSSGNSGLVSKVYRKSRHETFENLVDTIRYWDERRTAITLSATMFDLFFPIGNKVVPPGAALMNNYYAGVKRRNNSLEFHVGRVSYLLNKKITDNMGIERKVGWIWNYQALIAHKFKIQYPYECELGIGAGRSVLSIDNWDVRDTTIDRLPYISGLSPVFRLRFYRYNYTDTRYGLELKYQWVDYNKNNTLSSPIGKHYLSIGLVIRY